MKKILALVLSVILLKCLLSCNAEKGSMETLTKESGFYVETRADLLNLECPIYVDNVGYLSCVDFNEEKESVDFTYTISDELYAHLVHDKNYRDLQNIFKLQLATNVFSLRDMTEAAIEAGFNYNLVYENKNKGDKIEILIPTSELKSILNKYPSEMDAMLGLLKLDVDRTNSKDTGRWEDGYKLVSIQIQNIDGHNYINYDYEIDEEIYQLMQIPEFVAEFKQETDYKIEGIANQDDGVLVMVKADCGYRYNYYSNKHNFNLVFTYPASKMKAMIRDNLLRMSI